MMCEFKIFYRESDIAGAPLQEMILRVDGRKPELARAAVEKMGFFVVGVNFWSAVLPAHKQNFDREEACEYLGISERTLERLVEERKLPVCTHGTAIYTRRMLDNVVRDRMDETNLKLKNAA